VYIESSLKHFEQVTEVYNNWIKEAEEMMKQNVKVNKAPVLNAQGIDKMADFPVVQIHM
jgi:hypothetical protein